MESRKALEHLRVQIDAALHWDESLMRPMSFKEQKEFEKEHPGAHFVIGDFEIMCLHPEKYGLETRSPCDVHNEKMAKMLAIYEEMKKI